MKKIVLHFDINGTICFFDSTDPFDSIQLTNSYISRSVYGKIIDGKWIMNECYHDNKDSITYYKYLKDTTKEYAILSTKFTDKDQPGEKLKETCDQIHTENIFLFESFTKVLNMFEDTKIIFRTFGNDRLLILDELKKVGYNKHFIYCEMKKETLDVISGDENKSFTGHDEINNYLLNNDQNYIIKEDYSYWNDHKRDKYKGKMLIHSNDHIQYFFDDNDCVYIVNNNNNNMEQTKFIHINSLKARLDKDYFINHIKDINI